MGAGWAVIGMVWGSTAVAQVEFDIYRDFCILEQPWLCRDVACCTDHGYAAAPTGGFMWMPLRGVTNSTTAGRVVEWLGVSRTADPTFYRNTNNAVVSLPSSRFFLPNTVTIYSGTGGQPDAYAVLEHWADYSMYWPPGRPLLLEMRLDKVGSGNTDVRVDFDGELLDTNLLVGYWAWTNLVSLPPLGAGALLRITVGPGADGLSGAGVRVFARLSLFGPPRVMAYVEPSVVRYGSNATFTTWTDGSEPFRYQWHFQGSPIPGATGPTYTLTNAQLSDAGWYEVVVSDRFGTNSSQVSLGVDASPLITRQPGSLVALAGETARLDVAVAGLEPFAFQWRRDGADLPGATGASLSFLVSDGDDGSLYSVVVTNVQGAVTSAPARLYAATNHLAACDALSLSNAAVHGGYYRFACDGTMTLPREIVLRAPLRLDGAGHAVRLSGGRTHRLFYVEAGVPLGLRGLTLADGAHSYAGGAISCQGRLEARGCRFEGNQAGSFGGAVDMNAGGQLTLADCVFTNNLTTNLWDGWSGWGGAIRHAGGEVELTNCVFLGNVAREGGALHFYAGTARVTDCVLADGQAQTGGGIYNRGLLHLTRSRLLRNTAVMGGGLYHVGSGDVLVTESRFEDNVATSGGGVYLWNRAELTGTTFFRNRARGTNGATGGDGNGGGLWISGIGNLSLDRCLVASNSAEGGTGTNGAGGKGEGGGVYSLSFNNLNTAVNSTFFGNTASGGSGASPTTAGLGLGGAFFTRDSPWSVSHCTFVSNGAFAAGAPWSGSTLYVTNSTLRLRGSILARAAGGVHSTGAVVNLGFNLSSDGTPAFLNQSNSLNHVEARLGPLADNGGPSWTMALLPGSPALDAIPANATTTPVDQRGVARPAGAGADIGAFELGPAGAPRLSVVRHGVEAHLQYHAEAGRLYRLLRSPDLRAWTATDTNLVVANARVDFALRPESGSQAFYRVVTP